MQQAANQDGWIEWSGGACPVHPEVRVEVKFRDGWVSHGGNIYRAAQLRSCWQHDQRRGDILEYRVVQQ